MTLVFSSFSDFPLLLSCFCNFHYRSNSFTFLRYFLLRFVCAFLSAPYKFFHYFCNTFCNLIGNSFRTFGVLRYVSGGLYLLSFILRGTSLSFSWTIPLFLRFQYSNIYFKIYVIYCSLKKCCMCCLFVMALV